METYRLKNIAIVLLLLLNSFLLLLVGYQRLQERSAVRETSRQLRELCGASQLTLSAGLDLTSQPLASLAIARRAETELAIASYLLGGEVVPASQGGGIYSYETDSGSIQFRAGGSFYGSRIATPVQDIQAFCQTFCQQFGYEDPVFQEDGSAAAGQTVGGVDVNGSGVSFTFENGLLVAVTGAYVSMDAASPETAEGEMNCVTALVRFLDYRNASGAVCSEVRDIHCVYQLQGTAAARLLPVWQIDTDTNTYFVDCRTGDITGK